MATRTNRANQRAQFTHVSKPFDQVQSLNAREAPPAQLFFHLPAPRPPACPKVPGSSDAPVAPFHT